MFRNSFTLLLLSIGILLVVAPSSVRGECDCDNPIPDSDRGKVGDFFHKVGCGIKKGAKAVKETVEDGYKYVKNKIAPTPKPDVIDTAIEAVDSITNNMGRDQEFIYDIDVRNGLDGKNTTGFQLL